MNSVFCRLPLFRVRCVPSSRLGALLAHWYCDVGRALSVRVCARIANGSGSQMQRSGAANVLYALQTRVTGHRQDVTRLLSSCVPLFETIVWALCSWKPANNV